MAPASELDIQLVRAVVADALFGPDAVRTVQLGRFRLVRVLGRGAMGTVFEARDVSGTPLAIKVLHELGGPAIYRIKREFRSLAGVIHPNLVVLHELCWEDSRWFFTMELVKGIPFDRWVRGQRPRDSSFDDARLRHALSGLFAAVQAIHEAGKLHRDLKPANVLVTDDGTVKVLDFGLMSNTAEARSSAESGLLGTPAYMAPEAPKYAQASDWYSVGVMLFEALTGTLPFDGPPLQLLQEKQHREAPRADTRSGDLPPDLVVLAQQLLLRDPALRTGAAATLQAGCRVQAHGATHHSVSTSFVGRETELAVLRNALAKVMAGSAQVVLIGGPSGIGKTALLEHFCSESQGELLLAGRCYEQESVPYKVFDVVVDALARHLRQMPDRQVQRVLPRHLAALEQLFPVLRSVETTRPAVEDLKDSFEQRRRAFGALKELLLRLSDQAAVVITVDDLQWGDADSILMLRQLFAAPDVPPMLLVGTYRSDEAVENEFLQQLLEPGTFGASVHLHVVQMGPLCVDAGVDLVRKLSDSDELAAEAPSIVAESAGVPLFIVEFVRLLKGRHEHGAPRAIGAGRNPPSLHELISLRVNALPARAHRLLTVVCVAGGPVEERVAEQAAELHDDDGRALLLLRAAKLVRLQRGKRTSTVETYHDRVREAVLARIASDDLRQTHRLLADAMQAHGVADVERLIAHHTGAGDLVQAGEAAVAAARSAAQKLAFNHAAELLQRAIQLLPADYVRGEELHERLADALAHAGRGARAAEAYLAAAAGAEPERANQLQRQAAQQYLRSGRTKEGWELARRVLAGTGVQIPRSEVTTGLALLWERARLTTRTLRSYGRRAKSPGRHILPRLDALRDLSPELAPHHLVTGAFLQTRYLNEALMTDDCEHAVRALAWEVYNSSVMGGRRNETHVARVCETLSIVADEMNTPYARALTFFARSASMLFTARRYRDASAPALKAKEIFAQHCPGAFWERNVVDFLQLICLEFTGTLTEQVERSTEALHDATERDDQFRAGLMVLCVPYSHLVRDQPEAALDFLRKTQESLDARYTTERFLWLLRMTDALIYTGHAVDGLSLFTKEWPILARSHIFRSQYIRHDAYYFKARCALAVHAESGSAQALAVAQDAVRTLRRAPGVFSALAHAFTAGLPAHHREADARLSVAREQLEANQAPLIALYAHGRLSEQRGDHEGLEAVALELQRQGVVNPERWLWTHMPIRPKL